MLFLYALFISSFGFYGHEKLHWESDQLRYLFIYLCKKIASAPTKRDSGSSWGFVILISRASVSFGHMVGDFKTSSTGVENWASFPKFPTITLVNLSLSRLQNTFTHVKVNNHIL